MVPMLPLADALTPFAMGGCFMLVFGNWLLGKFEAWILGRRHAEPVKPGPMVGANYVSMAAGIGLLIGGSYLEGTVADDPVVRAPMFLGALLLVSFLTTCLVEWPFVGWAMGKFGFRRHLLRDVLVVNLASYAILTPFVLLDTDLAALSLRPSSAREMPLPGGWIYYAVPGEVRRVRLDGTGDASFAKAPKGADWPAELRFVRGVKGDTVDLVVPVLYKKDIMVSRAVAKSGQVAKLVDPCQAPAKLPCLEALYWTYGPKVELFLTPQITTGLSTKGRRYAMSSTALRLDLETPTALPDGKIISTYGRAIVVIDPERNRAVKLAIGESPLVVLDLPNER